MKFYKSTKLKLFILIIDIILFD